LMTSDNGQAYRSRPPAHMPTLISTPMEHNSLTAQTESVTGRVRMPFHVAEVLGSESESEDFPSRINESGSPLSIS
jgi:hypothetical protein